MKTENSIHKVAKMIEYGASQEEIHTQLLESGHNEQESYFIYVAAKLYLDSKDDDEPITERHSLRALPMTDDD